MTKFEVVRRLILAELTASQKVVGTIIAIVVPTVLRVALGQSANPVPFVTYFPAIMFAAIVLGWRWAAVATILSAAIVNRVFLARPWLQHPGTSDLAILIFFALSCSALILIGEILRRTVRELERLSRERDAISGELHHRVQNLLSVTAAMVKMTRATDIGEFRDDLTGRIRALSKANRFLHDGAATAGDVAGLIGDAVAPFRRDGAMFVKGPSLSLPPKVSYQLVLIVHELCTNAVKHGALSASHGQVHISWTGEHEPFRLEWREIGGPPVSPPARKGLGSRLLAGQSAFSVELAFEADGVVGLVTLVQSLAPPAA